MLGLSKKKYEQIKIIQIFMAGLDEVRPLEFIPKSISYKDNKLIIAQDEFDLKRFKNIYLAGSGKAAIDMAKAFSIVYPDKFKSNLIISNHYGARFTRLKIMQGGHPYPNKKSFAAGKAMYQYFKKMEMNDFFIYLLSGGSSALMEMTYGGLNYEDWSAITEIFLKEGLTIFETNMLRKKLSKIKSGNLGRLTSAHGVVLVASDVIDNDFSTIGSAPFYSSDLDTEKIKKILIKYDLIDKLPKPVVQELVRERPQQTHISYPHYIVAYNKMAIMGAVRYARSLKYKVLIIDEKVSGEAVEYGRSIARVAKTYENTREPMCLVYGGESTVRVRGKGLGGRNQELVLSAMEELKNCTNISILSVGTDGIDGPTNMAGAYFTPEILENFNQSKLDTKPYLENNDSYHFFKKLKKGHIELGNTGTNVGDIMIALIEPK